MKRFKPILGYLLLGVVLLIFFYYGLTHKQLWITIAHLNLLIIVLLLILYLIILGILILILKFTAELCGKKIDIKDNARISAYSLVVNFFGPLQSGPGVRAVYLRKNYNISLKNFISVTILYYIFYAAVSGVIAIAPSAYWRWLFLLIPVGLILSYLSYKIYIKISNKRSDKSQSIKKLNWNLVAKLFFITIAQITIQAIIYLTELKNVNHLITIKQAFIYTGVANFALFVSITPGAIGIREAFLLFSTKLHHIPSKSIIAASIIDRAVYIIFLGLLFVVTASLHVKSKLKIKNEEKIKSGESQN